MRISDQFISCRRKFKQFYEIFIAIGCVLKKIFSSLGLNSISSKILHPLLITILCCYNLITENIILQRAIQTIEIIEENNSELPYYNFMTNLLNV